MRLLFQNWNSEENQRRARFAIGVSLVAAFLVIFGPAAAISRGVSYDLPYFFAPSCQPTQAVIIKMDNLAHRQFDQDPRFRWNRALHAELIDFLQMQGATSIVFDVFLADPGVKPEELKDDEKLIRAIQSFGGKVVLAAVPMPPSYEDYVVPSWYGKDEPIPPAKKFTNAVGDKWGTAAVLLEKDREVIRRHWPDRGERPGLPWLAARMFGMTLKPGQRSEQRWLRYYGPQRTVPWVSYANYKSMPREFYAGKTVFVGGEPETPYLAGAAELFRTPFTLWTGQRCTGVEIIATTFLNLVRGDWLSEISPLLHFPLIVFVSLISGLLLAQFRPTTGAVVASAGLVLVTAVGILSVWLFRYWFDWVVIAGVQIPAAYATCAILYSRKMQQETESLTREKERIQKELDTIKSRGHTSVLVPPPIERKNRLVEVNAALQIDADFKIPPFELLRCIGEGAYGEVWLARGLTRSYRALKIIFRNKFSTSRPFEREFEGVRNFEPISLMHPGWVAILHVDIDEERGFFYYVMEAADDILSGTRIDPNHYTPKTLGKMLVEKPWLPVVDCVSIGIQLADALGALHKLGMVHRDVKPSNVIFVNGRVKLADIGLVVSADGPKSFGGTEGFMPEHGIGTPSADIFALGRTLYQTATGSDPKRQPGLPTALGERDDRREFIKLMDIINKACAPSEANRYQSAEDLRKDLSKLEASLNGKRKAIS